MNPALRFFSPWVAAAVLIFMAGCQDGGAMRLSDRYPISLDRMIAEAAKSRVIVAGETHDNRDHHDLQLRIIRTLHEGGTVLA
ncbi:MAG: ChaN family lipoprotein, partial [Syntrophobacterales bacterium]|nr:ChaN family lipoprotein [Syntrophobacterales bacterium]